MAMAQHAAQHHAHYWDKQLLCSPALAQLIFLQLSLTWLGLLYLRKVAVKTRKTGKLYWPNWVLIGGKEEEGGV